MLVKFNGRQPIRHENIFNDFFNFPSAFNTDLSKGAVAANVQETPEAYQLELNVPGRNKEDFKVNVENGLLTVSYEKKEETVTEGTKSLRREFSFNSFKRSFSLDEKVNTSAIQAKYENGILKIELPKKEEVKAEPTQIAIN
jgi:HSP20 family protein